MTKQSENFASTFSADIDSHANPIIVKIDPEIKDLIPEFLANRHKDIQALWDAYQHNNCAAIKFIAHRIKGVGGGYGFMTISEIGHELEQAIAHANMNYVAMLLHNFQDYLNRVQIVYAEN